MGSDRLVKMAVVVSAVYVAAAFGLSGYLAGWLGGRMPMLGAAGFLVAATLALTLLCLIRSRRLTLPLIILYIVGLGLFLRLHLEIAAVFGPAHYGVDAGPGLADLALLVGDAALRGLDLPDLLPAFSVSIRPVTSATALPRLVDILLAFWTAALIITVLLNWISGQLAQLEIIPPALIRGVPAGLAGIFLLTVVMGYLDSRSLMLLLLWPVDGAAKVVDIGDALQAFGVSLSFPEAGGAFGILAAAFRLVGVAGLLILISRLAGGTDGRKSVESLAEIFLSAEAPLEDRLAALETVANYGAFAEPAIPSLITTLGDPEKEIRTAAARALRGIDIDWAEGEAAISAVPSFVKATRKKDIEVRLAAVDALGEIGESAGESAPALVALLGDPAEAVRAAAAESLGRMGSAAEPAAPRLVALLTDDSDAVRGAAMETLTVMGPAAPPALIDVLDGDDPELRATALAALSEIEPGWANGELGEAAVARFTGVIREGFGEARISAIETLTSLGPAARKAIPDLVSVLIDGDRTVREAAVKALKAIDPKWTRSKAARSAAPDLIRALVDSDRNISKTARAVLTRVAPDWPTDPDTVEAVPHFQKALSHSLDTVRVAAADVLRELGPAAKPAVDDLMNALTDDRQAVRRAAAAALDAISPGWRESGRMTAEVEPLLEKLESDDWRVRAATCGTLGEMGAASAIPALVACLADPDKNVRAEATEALKRIDPKWPRNTAARKQIPTLLGALGHGQWGARAAAVTALGMFGPPAARMVAPRLVKMMNTDSILDVRSAAKRALARVDPKGQYHTPEKK